MLIVIVPVILIVLETVLLAIEEVSVTVQTKLHWPQPKLITIGMPNKPTLTSAPHGPTLIPTLRICPAPVVVVARLLAGLDPEVDKLIIVICVTVTLDVDEV
jgi:hypothetical protein